MTQEYWLKPNKPYVNDGWPGAEGSDVLGPNNFGTRDKPVAFTAAISWLIYIGKASEHILHFVGNDEPSIFYVGPDNWLGKRCQGGTSIYLQRKDWQRPNRKVIVRMIGHGNAHLFFTSRNYTQAEVGRFGGNVEDAVIRSPGGHYLDKFEMRDLTIDCNFKGQGYAAQEGSVTKGYRLHGIQVRALKGTIDNCRFINCGSNNSSDPTVLANECFPINVYALEPTAGAWTISRCEVSQFHAVNGGYATAIMPCMFTAKAEPTPVGFYPTVGPGAFVCTVEDCTVNGVPGINGLGTAGTGSDQGAYASHRICFRRNLVRNLTGGTNNDTGAILYQEYHDNTFIDCTFMAQLGTPTGGVIAGRPNPKIPTFHRNFKFLRNYARLKRHDIKIGADRVKAAGLLLRNNAAGIVWEDNIIVPLKDGHFCDWPHDAVDRSYREILLSGDEPYYKEYYYPSGPENKAIDPWIRDTPLTKRIEVS